MIRWSWRQAIGALVATIGFAIASVTTSADTSVPASPPPTAVAIPTIAVATALPATTVPTIMVGATILPMPSGTPTAPETATAPPATVVSTHTAISTATPSVTGTMTPGMSQTVTATPVTTRTATVTTTATIALTKTGTPTSTVTQTVAATVTPTVARTLTPTPARRSTRSIVGTRDFAPSPSVDLTLAPVTSSVLGPDQSIAVDLIVRAGTSEVIAIDAFLDFDPARLQVVAIDQADGASNPLPIALQEYVDPTTGHIDLSYGAITGPVGAGASGYFRLARITLRPLPGALAGLTAPVTTALAFALPGEANPDPYRGTTVYGVSDSLLRTADPFQVTLNPGASTVPAFPTPTVTTLYKGIPGEVAFTVLDVTNARLASATFTARLVPASAGTVTVASNTTDATGLAQVRVSPSVTTGTGVVDITVTDPRVPGGSQTLSRIVKFAQPVRVDVTIDTPATSALIRGQVPARATVEVGNGAPYGTRVEVTWSWSVASGTFTPLAPVAIVPGTGPISRSVATATWDTTVVGLAPPGTDLRDVVLRAEARAISDGAIIGSGESSSAGITVDNLAPVITSAKLGETLLPLDDTALTARRWVTSRAPVFSGEAEAGATIRAWRITAAGIREASPLASCVVPCPATTSSARTATRSAPTTGTTRRRDAAPLEPFTLPIPFTEADEATAGGLFIQFDAIDPAGNVGPAHVVGGTTTILDPITSWVAIDTDSPHIASVVTPVTVAPPNGPPSVITASFTEPVLIAASDFGTRIRLLQTISNRPVAIDATMTVTCAPLLPTPVSPAPVTASTTSARSVTVTARETCPNGVTGIQVTPTKALYPGGTYTLEIVSATEAPITDNAGNVLVENDSADPQAPRFTTVFFGPGTPPDTSLGISGIENGAVIHGTAATPAILGISAQNIDSDVTWRLCANPECSGDGGVITSIGIASPTITLATTTFNVVSWNTMATDGSGVRIYPDRADVYLVANGENTQLAGDPGQKRDVRRITLRSTPPVMAPTAIQAVTCIDGATASPTVMIGTIFNRARGNCNTVDDSLRISVTGTVPNSVGGTVTLVAQVDGGTPTTLASAIPFGADGTWIVPVTLPQGNVTLTVKAEDVAFPVANVAPDLPVSFVVDTITPVTTVSYPLDKTRIAAPEGSISIPVIGVTEPGSTLVITLTRTGADTPILDAVSVPVATSTFAFRYPAAAVATGTFLVPGTYTLVVRTTDAAGNPGTDVTQTFKVTPPPVAASLLNPGDTTYPGFVGKAHDAEPDLYGIQVVLRGQLPAGTLAEAVPDGLLARLRRNGKDAVGDGNRPIIAPVTLVATGTYGFTFPTLTFTADATATYTVVTVDDFGNQSQESAPLNLVVDTTAPEFRVATPSDGQTIGALSPELAILVNPNADGTWDITQATFEVRKTVEIGPPEAFRIVKSATVNPLTLGTSAAGAGVVGIDPSEWAPELERPVEPAITQKYELRVTGRDRLGNTSSVATMFTLRPGAPAVTVLGDGNRVIGNLDVTRNTLPLVTTQVTVSGGGVSITGITGTIRQRGTTGVPIPLTLTGTGATRTVSLAGLVLPNGTAHDLAITATDSNADSTTTTVTLRVIRPRAITVTVTKGTTPVAGATVQARRDAGDLPAVSVDEVTSGSGLVSFPSITGGPVLLAVGGVPGYPVTTIAASVTEPFATTGNAWPIAIDLDALNPNTITTTLRGLPLSVTTPATGSVDDNVHISIEPQGGSRLTDVPVGSATSGLVRTYADDIATIDRTIVAPGLTVTGKFVTSTVRVPAGANAWTVTPSLAGDAKAEATLIGTTSATAVFTATGGENLPVTLRYLASNLRVKTLTGTVRRVDQTTVAGATIIISQPGGLSVRAITGPDGTYGPVFIEGGDYTVAAIASPGANWIPDRAGRVSFATDDDALTPETDTVDLRVLAAGGIVQARLERAVSGDTSLITGTAILTSDGQVITARAGGSVLIGADEATGANVSIAAPAGVYVLTFIPDDGSLTSPEPMTIRVVDGRTLVLSSTDLPPLTRQMGTLVGKVRLTDGTPLAGLTVQAHPDGVATVTPAVTDGDGLYRLTVASGTYVISAVIPRGAALLPPNGVTASVAPSGLETAPDIILTAATAVIERTLVKAGAGTATIALSTDEAAGISGTAYIKDETTNVGTSFAFNGSKIRVSVPPGSYRLSISITAGGFLAPSPETGIIATAGVPATGERIVTPSDIVVSGQLVSNQTNASPGTSVALRSIVRATGITGAGSGVIYVTESSATGAFTFKLAPGTWRLSASPDAGQGYSINVDRPYTNVVVAATGTVTPALPGIDLREANRVIQGTAIVEINGSSIPLSGVKIRLDISSVSGGSMSVTAETNSRGRFSALVAEGGVTLTANGANASFADTTETTNSGRLAGDPAWVIDPVPTGVTDSDTPLTVSFVNASTVISGTVDRTSTDRVGGATITATSTSGLVRTTTSTTGSNPGSFALRLSDGEWTIVANADLTLASGSRVAAASVPQVITVTGSSQTGISLALVASSTPIAPAASAPGDPETGAQVRAGFGSAELRLTPGAVSEAVTVTVEPLGNAPALPGFVPFGDAFRIGLVTSTGQTVGALNVDSTILITYPSANLAKYKAPSTAPAGQTIAQPSDIRPARFDAITSAYTPMTNATASSPDTSTGQFAISTTTLGTFVLTTREVLVLAPVPPPPPPPNNGDGGGGGTSGTVKPVVIVPTVLAIAPTAVIGPPSPDLSAPFIADYVIVTEPFVLPPFTPFMTSGLRIPTDFSEGGLAPVIISPDRTVRLPDGRTEIRATAQPGPAPVLVRVTAKETAAVTLTGGPVTLAFAVPNLVGEENAVVAVRIPASVFVAINRVSPDASLTVLFDPAPPTANEVERGSLGGGGVTPLGMPFDLRMEVRAADGTGIPLKNLAVPKPDGDASLPTVQVAMPVPGRYLNGGNGTFAYLLGLYDGTPSGGFLGYLRPPATFDGRAGTQTLEQPIDSFGGSLILPVDLAPSYVANHSADAHLWSGPTADAIDFGPVGEQFTLLTVVAPQVGFRINVYNPITKNYGWIDVDAVGPADAPATVTVLPTPTVMPSVPTITAVRPTLVQNVDAEAHLWSNPTTAAVDFGLVGRTGVIYTVIDQQMQRYFVVNEETGNYAWIDVSNVRPYVPVLTPSPTVTRVLTPTVTSVPSASAASTARTRSADVRVFSNPTAAAIDFGPVGPAGTVLTVIGPQDGSRTFIFNPVTENYGWVNLTDIEPVAGPPAPTPVVTTPTRTTTPVATTSTKPAMPSGALPKLVRTTNPDAHVFAHEGPGAADFGLIGPVGTVLTVIGPQLEGRLFVFNPVTENYGWVNLTDTIAVDGPPAPTPVVTTPTRTASTSATTVPTVSAPSTARTRSADARVFSNPTAAAIDFGPVGPSGTVLTIIGPQDGSRTFIFNPVTENYGWVEIADLEP